MKSNIHPEYKLGTVTCACGNTFQVRSTVGDFKVEICSACHPFFTGKQKLVDSAGRVEKFMKKYGLSSKAGGSQQKTTSDTKATTEGDNKEEAIAEA